MNVVRRTFFLFYFFVNLGRDIRVCVYEDRVCRRFGLIIRGFYGEG